MASLVYGLGRALNYLFLNANKRAQFDQSYRNDFQCTYNPHAEILGTLVKTCVATGVYFTFSKLMPQNSSPLTTIATGALLYKGLINTVGPQATDLGIAAWVAAQSVPGSQASLRRIIISLGGAIMSVAVFAHFFSIGENVKNLGSYLDKFSTVPPFNWKTHPIWCYLR